MSDPKLDMRETTKRAVAAFAVVAEKVFERARQTGTNVVLWEDGDIVEVDPNTGEKTRPEAGSEDTAPAAVQCQNDI